MAVLLSFGQLDLASSTGGEPPPETYTCIDLEKTGPETAEPGDTITYHFWVKNCGNVVLHGGAQVYDPLFGSGAIWGGIIYPGVVVEFDKTYTLPDDHCDDFRNDAWAVGHPLHPDGYYLPDVIDGDSWTVEIICEPPPGTGTPGYWKNHPDAWPVDEITIGGVTYTKDKAIEIMNTPENGDKTYTMSRSLVAAKLNVFVGNESSCIDDTIEAADAWMAAYPAGSGVEAGGKNSPWREGEPLYETLDKYNNGELCAPSRDDLE